MKPSLKVFLMAVFGFLITTVSTLQQFNAWYVVIVTVCFAGEYALKNYFLPSTSPEGTLFWQDIISGLVLAVLMGFNNLAASLLTGVALSWAVVWSTVSGAVVGYFTKTVASGQKATV